MTNTPSAPFYFDWTFWSFVVAACALLLSQLPHVKLWFRKGRLEVDVQGHIHLSHRIGHPNVQIYISMTNSGRRALRVTAARMHLLRDGTPLPELAAQNVFEHLRDEKPVMFVPFVLRPEEQRGHPFVFYESLSRAADNDLRKLITDLRIEHMAALALRAKSDPNDSSDIPGSPTTVIPILDHFKKTFVWEKGEYKLDLMVNAAPDMPSVSKSFRFTLFESDAALLRSYSEGFVFGAGVWYDVPKHEPLRVQLSPT